MNHDMNHDGKIDGRDFALLHNMLDGDQKTYPSNHKPQTNSSSASKALLLLTSGLYLSLLLNGVLPVNTFTALVTIFNLICFIKAFCGLFL